MFTCDVTKAHSFAHLCFTVNYRFFAHSDFSYRFNGEKDNIVLEYSMIHVYCTCVLRNHECHLICSRFQSYKPQFSVHRLLILRMTGIKTEETSKFREIMSPAKIF